jgi:phosphoglucomutase
MAINLAEQIHADLVMATDPDADRVGIAIRNHRNEMILLNGNQTAALLFYYVLNRWKEAGRFEGNEFIVKTIVSSELLSDIAVSFGVEYFNCLTGFKFIADVIRSNEGVKRYIIGGEESYGYLIGDFVRDKDAISACALIAETAAWMADQGKSLFDLLLQLYLQYGFYKESLLSVTKKGKSGAEDIQQMMVGYRTDPPVSINNSRVIKVKDYLSLREKNLVTGKVLQIDLPKSNVLQFILEDGSIISVRPSGTEPKIKFYFGVREKMVSTDDYERTDQLLNAKIEEIIASMKLK